MWYYFVIFVTVNQNLSIMTEFKIRAYGRMELAQLYSPTLTDIAAYRKMKKWISLEITFL